MYVVEISPLHPSCVQIEEVMGQGKQDTKRTKHHIFFRNFKAMSLWVKSSHHQFVTNVRLKLTLEFLRFSSSSASPNHIAMLPSAEIIYTCISRFIAST